MAGTGMTDQREQETSQALASQLDLARPAVSARETSAQRMRRLMVQRVEKLKSFRTPTVAEIEERLFLEEYLGRKFERG